LNTLDVAGASWWYHGSLASEETLPPIEAAEEEESAKRRNDGKSYKKDIEHEETLTADIERRVAAAVNEISRAQGSAFARFPGQTSHDMPIPPGYASVCVERICQPDFKELEIDITGGDGKRHLRMRYTVSYYGQNVTSS
jgi:hypothetical protein